MKRRRNSKTSSKGDTDSGSQAWLIRTSSWHKHLSVQLSSCLDKVQSAAQRGVQPSCPAPASLLAGDSSSVLWVTPVGPNPVPGWPRCQAGALRTNTELLELAPREAEPGARGREGSSVLGWWQPRMKIRHQTKAVPAFAHEWTLPQLPVALPE